MKQQRHPVIAGLITLGYSVCGLFAFWILSFAVILFFSQLDEAWNGSIWVLMVTTLFGFPFGVLLAIGSYFKARMPASKKGFGEECVLPMNQPRRLGDKDS
jgi:RsiW-degrading membrane proteinase PrsW (M82 family)